MGVVMVTHDTATDRLECNALSLLDSFRRQI